MYIPGLTTLSLLKMHETIRDCLVADDTLPRNAKRLFEIRENEDWKNWTELIEVELARRKVAFSRLNWDKARKAANVSSLKAQTSVVEEHGTSCLEGI